MWSLTRRRTVLLAAGTASSPRTCRSPNSVSYSRATFARPRMTSADLSRRVGKVVGYPPLAELSELQRRELHEALLEAATLRSARQVAGSDCERGAEPAGAAT